MFPTLEKYPTWEKFLKMKCFLSGNGSQIFPLLEMGRKHGNISSFEQIPAWEKFSFD
jgi:hypothetical protein